MTIRLTYDVTVDGYLEHPEGELIVVLEDWVRLKQYHVAIGKEYVSSSSSGGSVEVAIQILASRGVRFTQTVAPPRSAFVSEDE